MSEWSPIETVGKPRVIGVLPEYQGLLDVEVSLSRTPDRDWAALFDDPQIINLGMHPPKLAGRTARLRPPDDQLKKYVEELNSRVQQTNRRYEEQVLPRITEAEEQSRLHAEQERERLEKARREAEDL